MRNRLISTAVVSLVSVAVLPFAALLATAPANAAPGNNGTIKVAEVDDVGTNSNDPKVACTFALEWYNFDAAAVSDVTFDSPAQTTITGPMRVTLDNDTSGGNSGLDGREIYTLTYLGTLQTSQTFPVKVTTNTTGSNGNDSKSKTFKVEGACAAAPTTPGDDTPPTAPGDDTPTTPGDTTTTPFDWNWHYADPTCTAVTVAYPSNIPSGQANDANIRFRTASGEFTLNFHNNTGTWSGTHAFTYADHPSWPAGLTSYDVVWVQVGGTNYHWQGDVECRPVAPPVDVPPFDWNWHYPNPTCTALNVTYPANIPSGQANDANIRFESNVGQFTLNFHNNTGTWSGAHSFDYTTHPSWPAGVTSYHVVWTQVGGTNYHWQGDVACGAGSTPTDPTPADPAPADPAPADPAPADPAPAASVSGFDDDVITVGRGHAPSARIVVVHGAGSLVLERLVHGKWVRVKAVSADDHGIARVTFPKLKKAGTYAFRLSAPSVSGACSGVLTFQVH